MCALLSVKGNSSNRQSPGLLEKYCLNLSQQNGDCWLNYKQVQIEVLNLEN